MVGAKTMDSALSSSKESFCYPGLVSSCQISSLKKVSESEKTIQNPLTSCTTIPSAPGESPCAGPVVPVASTTKRVDLVHMPQLIFQTINADQRGTPGQELAPRRRFFIFFYFPVCLLLTWRSSCRRCRLEALVGVLVCLLLSG